MILSDDIVKTPNDQEIPRRGKSTKDALSPRWNLLARGSFLSRWVDSILWITSAKTTMFPQNKTNYQIAAVNKKYCLKDKSEMKVHYFFNQEQKHDITFFGHCSVKRSFAIASRHLEVRQNNVTYMARPLSVVHYGSEFM